MQSNFIADCLNNRRYKELLGYIEARFGLDVSEAAQILNVQKEELEGYTGSPTNVCLETKLGIFAEFARLGFEGRLKACAEALVNSENAAAFSKLCGVNGTALADPKNSASAEEKYRLAVGIGFLAALYQIDLQAQTEENK